MLTPQVTYYRVLDASRLIPEYLYFAFQSAPFQRQITSMAKDGATRAYIGITRQLQLSVSIPDIETQNDLVELFRQAEAITPRLVADYDSKVADLDKLRQSLLQKAFAGELTTKEFA